MATVLSLPEQQANPIASVPLTVARAVPSVQLDWAMTAVTTWFVGGVFLDGWAHNNIPDLETFFTPWHAVLYSGYAATALLVLLTFLWGLRKGFGWRHALPAGYGLAVAGSAIFFLGGMADMLWHITFGIEANVDALLSPTHLVLALGGLMMQAAPFRAWWQRHDSEVKPRLIHQLPAFLSLAYVWSVLAFFTQYVHPFTNAWASGTKRSPADPFFGQALGAVSIIVQTALLAGVVLLAARRRPLPPGALILLFTVNGLLVNAMHGQPKFLAAAIVAGLCTDALYAWLRPSMAKPGRIHLFAFLLPLPLYGLYFAVPAPGGIVWSIHLWAGSIAIAGVTAWLLSYVAVPPDVPAEAS